MYNGTHGMTAVGHVHGVEMTLLLAPPSPSPGTSECFVLESYLLGWRTDLRISFLTLRWQIACHLLSCSFCRRSWHACNAGTIISVHDQPSLPQESGLDSGLSGTTQKETPDSPLLATSCSLSSFLSLHLVLIHPAYK